MIKIYFKTAWRNVLKRKGFTTMNVGGLALGISSFILLMLYVSYHLSFDKRFTKIDNVFVVMNNQPGDGKIYTFNATPKPLAQTIQAEVPGITAVARTGFYNANGVLTYKDNAFKKTGLFADADLFKILSYEFVSGDPASALRQPNSVVLTEDLAGVLFGKSNPINKIIKRNNQTELVVTGVIKNVPNNSTMQFDFIMPWQLLEDENTWVKTANWESNFCQTLVQLKDPADVAKAQMLVGKMINSHQSAYKGEAMLFPYAKLHLYSKFENGKSIGGLINQVNLFIVLAMSILLIACFNFMNLSTARSEERAREVGIRKAIGSSKLSLIFQFLTESVLISFLATIIAVILTVISLPYLNRLLNTNLVFPYDNVTAWAFIILIAAVTGIIAGSYPAIYLSSFEPVSILKGLFKGGGGALSLRKILVIVQFTFAVFLISGTICIYRQIKLVQGRSVGYEKNKLVEIKLEGNIRNHQSLLIHELKNTGAVANATNISQSITQSNNNTWGFSWPGKDPNQKILIDVMEVGYDFCKTASIKLLAGRQFSSDYPADTAGETVMINEAAAKVMQLKNPVGAVISKDNKQLTVVGVFNDFVTGSPYVRVAPMVTYCNLRGSIALLSLSSGKSISESVDKISSTLKQLNPAYPPVVNFVDSDFEKKFENERLLALLANLFGGLAIGISCIGLFGLTAFAAEQRIKEIGVRKVLGASVINLAGLLSKDYLKLVVFSIIIAVPISLWGINKWLQTFEYRISLSWGVLLLSATITLIIAVITVSFQATKAALANPVKSLRN